MKFLDTKQAKKLHQKRKKMYLAGERYRNKFRFKKNGLIKPQYLENRSCPTCKSKKSDFLFIKNGGTYNRCKICTMVFLNPVFKNSMLIQYYKKNHSYQAEAHKTEKSFYNKIYNHGLSKILKFKRKGKILDLGCSGGFFLDLAKKKGFETYGIELNEQEKKEAELKNHKVWDRPIEDIKELPKFDIICLWDVFEHIKNGVELLKILKNKLRKRGIIFLQLPNSDSLATRILHSTCNMFDGIEHVNLYNGTSLRLVAKKSKMKIKAMSSVIDELKPISNYLNYEDPYHGSFNSKICACLLSKKKILKNNLGYKLQVILQ